MLLERLLFLKFFSNNEVERRLSDYFSRYSFVLNQPTMDKVIDDLGVSRSTLKRFINQFGVNYKRFKEYLLHDYELVENYEVSVESPIHIISYNDLFSYMIHDIKVLLKNHIEVYYDYPLGKCSKVNNPIVLSYFESEYDFLSWYLMIFREECPLTNMQFIHGKNGEEIIKEFRKVIYKGS